MTYPPTTEPLAAEATSAEPVKSGMTRETPTPDPSRAALVKHWQGKVANAKKHWEKDFKRMKEDQAFLGGAQWDGREEPDKYTANIIQRHINHQSRFDPVKRLLHQLVLAEAKLARQAA